MSPTSFSLGKSAPAGSSTSRNRQSGRHPSFTSKYSNFSFSTTVLVESICLPTSSAYLSSGFQIVVQLGTLPEIEVVNIRNEVPNRRHRRKQVPQKMRQYIFRRCFEADSPPVLGLRIHLHRLLDEYLAWCACSGDKPLDRSFKLCSRNTLSSALLAGTWERIGIRTLISGSGKSKTCVPPW
jgi:hypothetical protein